jgi:hypothetical protein
MDFKRICRPFHMPAFLNPEAEPVDRRKWAITMRLDRNISFAAASAIKTKILA